MTLIVILCLMLFSAPAYSQLGIDSLAYIGNGDDSIRVIYRDTTGTAMGSGATPETLAVVYTRDSSEVIPTLYFPFKASPSNRDTIGTMAQGHIVGDSMYVIRTMGFSGSDTAYSADAESIRTRATPPPIASATGTDLDEISLQLSLNWNTPKTRIAIKVGGTVNRWLNASGDTVALADTVWQTRNTWALPLVVDGLQANTLYWFKSIAKSVGTTGDTLLSAYGDSVSARTINPGAFYINTWDTVAKRRRDISFNVLLSEFDNATDDSLDTLRAYAGVVVLSQARASIRDTIKVSIPLIRDSLRAQIADTAKNIANDTASYYITSGKNANFGHMAVDSLTLDLPVPYNEIESFTTWAPVPDGQTFSPGANPASLEDTVAIGHFFKYGTAAETGPITTAYIDKPDTTIGRQRMYFLSAPRRMPVGFSRFDSIRVALRGDNVLTPQCSLLVYTASQVTGLTKVAGAELTVTSESFQDAALATGLNSIVRHDQFVVGLYIDLQAANDEWLEIGMRYRFSNP